MGRYRKSFGFKGVNGRAIKIIVKSVISNKAMDRNAPRRLVAGVKNEMNKAGKWALRTAKNRGWSPYLRGPLIASIRWRPARVTAKGNIVRGELKAGSATVQYAARWELYHKTKKKYLYRAIKQVALPIFERAIKRKGFIEGTLLAGVKFS